MSNHHGFGPGHRSGRPRSFWISGVVITVLIILVLGYVFSANAQEAPKPAAIETAQPTADVGIATQDVGSGTQINPEEAPPPEENDAVPTDDLLATEQVTVTATEAIRVPWGNLWVSYADLLVQGVLLPLIFGLIAWGLAKAPKPLRDIWYTMRAEQLLTRAAAYGVNATKGAAAGRTLDVNVGSTAVARAGNYAIKHGSTSLIEWLGKNDGIVEKLISRIELDADVDGTAVKEQALHTMATRATVR